MIKSDEEYILKQANFLFDFKWINLFDRLNDADCGKLIKGVMHYARERVIPNWANDDSRLAISFEVITPTIDANAKKYIETCKKRSKDKKDYWDNKKNGVQTEPNYDSDAYKQKASNPQYKPKKQ